MNVRMIQKGCVELLNHQTTSLENVQLRVDVVSRIKHSWANLLTKLEKKEGVSWSRSIMKSFAQMVQQQEVGTISVYPVFESY